MIAQKPISDWAWRSCVDETPTDLQVWADEAYLAEFSDATAIDAQTATDHQFLLPTKTYVPTHPVPPLVEPFPITNGKGTASL